ncbi:MAG: YicC/YloC family endoribonuclease [Thermacetogeniaceae bacterium]|nr:YicC/YloC family endoribonuclease [Thermoanaerobacterales bacterium]HAF18114.1 YicC family protein [Peptococcaceae bacterium]
MIKSMTGFGRGECDVNGLHAVVEIRSVNHRFREITVRISRSYFQLEEKIKSLIQDHVARGHLDVYVNIEDRREKKRNVKLDKELLIAYDKCLREMAEILNIEYDIELDDLSRLPDVLLVEEKEEDIEEVWTVVQQSLRTAVKEILEMREREGARLYEDFIHRKRCISKLLAQIKEREPQLNEELRARLHSKLQQILDDHEIDESRLATEVVLFAERSSITEELVRLSSHLEQLEESLQTAEPVGRKIEFLLQEMNREINTIGSKAADLIISPLVVEIKSQIEKMREQAQNIE